MKKKIAALLGAVTLCCALMAGCGSGGDAAPSSSVAGESQAAESELVQESQAPESETAPASSVVVESEPAQDTQSEAGSSTEESSAAPEAQNAAEAAALEDGVYTADFNTDSSMFHVNEAYDGKGTLTVENGEMTIHVSLVSKNILNLFAGLADDAQKDGAVLLEPTTDVVDYGDGTTDEVYGFDIPVPVLDEEFDVAIVGKKGVWYDHKVSVSNPEKTE